MTGGRLLDVGCGWGSMVIHAATHFDVTAVGITISEAQAERARQRVAEAGVADRVEIRLQDYRDISGQEFDAISSVGMSEHVGRSNLDRYYGILHGALRPEGRLLNHAISKVGGTRITRASFLGRYVFPDGELIDVGESVLSMERAGFEVRDVESLREHYVRTLRGLGRQPRGGLGRGRAPRRRRAGAGVAALHGRLGDGVRRQRGRAPPGPRRRPDAIGVERDAPDPRRRRSTATRQSAAQCDGHVSMIWATFAESRYSSRRVMWPSAIATTMHAGTSTRRPARFVATSTCCCTKPSSVADRRICV